MKNLTYHNLVRGIKIMERKGYDREEAERLARLQFDTLANDKENYWTFEMLAERVLDKEAWEEEVRQYAM